MAPRKKNKQKSQKKDNSNNSSGFNYDAVVPSNLSGDQRDLVMQPAATEEKKPVVMFPKGADLFTGELKKKDDKGKKEGGPSVPLSPSNPPRGGLSPRESNEMAMKMLNLGEMTDRIEMKLAATGQGTAVMKRVERIVKDGEGASGEGGTGGQQPHLSHRDSLSHREQSILNMMKARAEARQREDPAGQGGSGVGAGAGGGGKAAPPAANPSPAKKGGRRSGGAAQAAGGSAAGSSSAGGEAQAGSSSMDDPSSARGLIREQLNKVLEAKGKGRPKQPPPPFREVECLEDWGEDANAHLHAAPRREGPLQDTQEKRVPVEIADEIRKTVSVAWWASPFDADDQTDTHIVDYAQSLGRELYNYISYPIGGMKRSKASPNEDEPAPPINLPDVQVNNAHWEQYVAGHPSLWIRCDDIEDEDGDSQWHTVYSGTELEKELNYAQYLGLRLVTIELWHKNATGLAAVIRRFLWTVQSEMRICILLPSQASMMDGDEDDEREVWEIWADFRTLCGNFSGDRLCCGIKLLENLDDEFVDESALERWHAEPITMFTMETNVFITNERTGGADLGPAHTRLLETLWTSESMSAAIRGQLRDPKGARIQYAQAIRSIIGPLWLKKKLTKKQNFLDKANVNYQDIIQKPLQPLADNLASGVYNTFEADTPKYKYYGVAIEAAIRDMVKKRGTGDIVLYVLGAGRGPLMSAAIKAEKKVNDSLGSGGPRVRMELVCVEKNENAIVTLNYLNATLWKGRVRIVQADMRELKQVATDHGLRRPDIIVSELLGSFGDNELSPECLDGCIDWLKEDTLSVPQSYTSYCEPVASMSLFQSIKAQAHNYYLKGRQANGRRLTAEDAEGRTYTQDYPQGREIAQTDMLYVVYLEKCVRQMSPKKYFTFTHEAPFSSAQTERERTRATQMWECPETQDIMGFACYFSAQLYKEVTLSIVRGDETPDMMSWFPAVLPLREPLRVRKGEQLSFVVERCVEANGVWYEWFAIVASADGKESRRTELQNKGGVSYYMRLISEKTKELMGNTPTPPTSARSPKAAAQP